jgi:ABC-type molybdate transport system substrate-binding protein
MIRALTVALAMAVIAGPAAAETVALYAAGSLKAALTDVAKAYETASGNTVQAKFGASGLLKDEIAGGAKADVFASANMEHPRALHDAKKSGPMLLFARNRLCADEAGTQSGQRQSARADARSSRQARHFDAEGRPSRRLRLRGVPQGLGGQTRGRRRSSSTRS